MTSDDRGVLHPCEQKHERRLRARKTLDPKSTEPISHPTCSLARRQRMTNDRSHACALMNRVREHKSPNDSWRRKLINSPVTGVFLLSPERLSNDTFSRARRDRERLFTGAAHVLPARIDSAGSVIRAQISFDLFRLHLRVCLSSSCSERDVFNQARARWKLEKCREAAREQKGTWPDESDSRRLFNVHLTHFRLLLDQY